MRGVGRGMNVAARGVDRKGQGAGGEESEPLMLFGRVPSVDRARKLVKVCGVCVGVGVGVGVGACARACVRAYGARSQHEYQNTHACNGKMTPC